MQLSLTKESRLNVVIFHKSTCSRHKRPVWKEKWKMNGEKNVKLSTLKSNGIFLFSYVWLNLRFKMWLVCLCVMFVSVSAHGWAARVFASLKIVHACVCAGFCAAQLKTPTGVIQNRNCVPCSACSSAIFLLINRSQHKTLASAFSISPWSREEMASIHLSVFILLFFLASLREDTVLI